MDRSSKWFDFQGEGYELVDLGRPAVFLIPSHLLRKTLSAEKSQTIEELIETTLMEHFGAFTRTMVPEFGFWRSSGKRVCYDECRRYEVSFLGKEHITMLMSLLARVARIIGEDCLYFKAGQYACLIYPKTTE